MPHGFQYTRCAQRDDIACILGRIEAHADMALGAEVIYLIWLNAVDEVGELCAIGEVPVMKEKPYSWLMGVNIDMVDSGGAESARPSDNAMYLIAFSKQEFSEIGTILPGNAGNKCFFHNYFTSSQ